MILDLDPLGLVAKTWVASLQERKTYRSRFPQWLRPIGLVAKTWVASLQERKKPKKVSWTSILSGNPRSLHAPLVSPALPKNCSSFTFSS
jgi:hypothetical protein